MIFSQKNTLKDDISGKYMVFLLIEELYFSKKGSDNSLYCYENLFSCFNCYEDRFRVIILKM